MKTWNINEKGNLVLEQESGHKIEINLFIGQKIQISKAIEEQKQITLQAARENFNSIGNHL